MNSESSLTNSYFFTIEEINTVNYTNGHTIGLGIKVKKLLSHSEVSDLSQL